MTVSVLSGWKNQSIHKVIHSFNLFLTETTFLLRNIIQDIFLAVACKQVLVLCSKNKPFHSSSLRSAAGGQRIDLYNHFFFGEKNLLMGTFFLTFLLVSDFLTVASPQALLSWSNTNSLAYSWSFFDTEYSFYAWLPAVKVETSFGIHILRRPYFFRLIFCQHNNGRFFIPGRRSFISYFTYFYFILYTWLFLYFIISPQSR